jgi:hypothetical protein
MAEVGKDRTQEALREGLFVRALGRPSSSNPYPPNCDEHALWDKGWRWVDESGENAPPAGAGSRSKLVPDFMLGGPPTLGRQPPLKAKAIALSSVRAAVALRVLGVIVMIVLMLVAVAISAQRD